VKIRKAADRFPQRVDFVEKVESAPKENFSQKLASAGFLLRMPSSCKEEGR
jgi:hypothetical protein